MKNKIRLKKTIVCSICVTIIINIVFAIISYYQYKTYTKNFNEKIVIIMNKIVEEYPEADKNELMAVLNSSNSTKKFLFEDYGIDINKDTIVLENDIYFKRFLGLNVSIILFLGMTVIFIFLRYNRNKDKKLKEITRYIEEINNKNYKLDIADNTEDELSILKNEIYKITVMLKEAAENSKKDKILLKDSLSDISHQLKTPLTSITITLDNLLENPNMDISTRNEFINDIKRQIVNINFLVSSLLKLSKLDANSIKFVNKNEEIGNILKESIKNVEVLCDLKNIQININGDSEQMLFCDFKWQVEAITNILKNAVEHSNENSKIDIFIEKNKVYLKIEIKDYGKGIDKQELPHIFERFFKGKNSSSESVGIGLALAKTIIEKNNGYVAVFSEIDKGTTFTLKFFSICTGSFREKNRHKLKKYYRTNL